MNIIARPLFRSVVNQTKKRPVLSLALAVAVGYTAFKVKNFSSFNLRKYSEVELQNSKEMFAKAFMLNVFERLGLRSFGVQCRERFDVKAQLEKIRAIKKSNPGNIAVSVFDESYFNTLTAEQQQRLLQIVNSGVENADSEMGCYAYNPTDYEEFYPFFKLALEKYHKVNLTTTKHINDWDLSKLSGLPSDGKLDLQKLGLGPLSMRVRTGRNLKKYPLPGAMNQDQRVALEQDMERVFEKLIADPAFGGEYCSLTPGSKHKISDEKYAQLVKAHLMFKDMSKDSFLLSAGIARDWPHGRGCYVSADKGFIIWVGEEDHLRIMAMQKGTILNAVFDRLKAAIDIVEDLIPGGCAKSQDFGVVTSCPTNMGTGMRASVHLQLPNLTADGTDQKVKAICKPFGLGVRGLGGEHTPIGEDGTVDISPSARFCISEAQILAALYKGIDKVWKEELKSYLNRGINQANAEAKYKTTLLKKLE